MVREDDSSGKNHDLELLEAMQASHGMDIVASYLSRGRWLQSLNNALLTDVWLLSLGRFFLEGSRHEAMNDVYAERSLRGITHVELPSDLAEAVQTFGRAMVHDPDVWWNLLDEIDRFAKSLGPSNN
jgi:hypothetical protein